MLSEKLRARLELLNRSSLPADRQSDVVRDVARDGEDIVRAVEARHARSRTRRNADDRSSQTLSPAAPSIVATLSKPPSRSSPILGEELKTQAGQHWRIRQPIASLWPAFDQHFGAWQANRSANSPPAASASADSASAAPIKRLPARVRRHAANVAAEVDALAQSLPQGALFLDLETCGLAGSALFLIGLVRHDGEQLVLEQLLARNYAEEQAVLHTLWRIAAQATLLVTFNGKSFDWPLVRDRTTYHRIDRDPAAPTIADLPHVDVLHHARRRWRDRLPDCRLQTLERFLCGRHRSGDIPGRDIPEAYRQYVATGRVDQMRAILHHNALDLVTLLQLAMQLTEDDDEAAGASADEPKRRAPRLVDDAA